MKALISNKPLISFFVLAFLLSWVAVSPLLLNPELPIEPFQILGALAGPTLSAVIVVAVTEGRHGLRRFFARYIQWRAGILWWLIVLFGVLLAITLVATALIGSQVLSRFITDLGLVIPNYLLTLVVGIILGPLWEEPGWRGFALPRLQAQLTPLLGTLLLGLLWALWHIPGYLGGWLQANPFAFLVSCLAFSVMMTWVYNHTRGSILLMILLHSSANAALSVGARVLPDPLPASIASLVNNGWIPALTYLVAALLIIVGTRGTLSYRKHQEIPETMEAHATV